MEEDRIKWIARPAFPRLPRLKAVESQTGNQVMKVMEVRHKLYLVQHVFLGLSTSESVHVVIVARNALKRQGVPLPQISSEFILGSVY